MGSLKFKQRIVEEAKVTAYRREGRENHLTVIWIGKSKLAKA